MVFVTASVFLEFPGWPLMLLIRLISWNNAVIVRLSFKVQNMCQMNEFDEISTQFKSRYRLDLIWLLGREKLCHIQENCNESQFYFTLGGKNVV